ncbi:hypothetical protein BAUCODRAFT_35544 [Baudoinia panamericana UAMH 10762]|uniref:Uncharacterized protein n=1 Tax=Baudoinia panamericana (strain UAMH 10762) TaxID=717646 RepID=M2N5M4_BAUPA|nr:uncharacterized protein BAUCODRAFT_35544 [Baudoinia panamericana UAMH 10762]EMC94344.1 hypothetical protein BAUCODRAFT_35544 [Baudoinia panamericana UAMH 10762]
MPALPIPDVKNDPSKVQLARLGFFIFEHPKLADFERFAEDFGFIEAERTDNTICYRGYGRDPVVYVAVQSPDGRPRFRGPAFVAKDADEFEKAARLPGASPVKQLDTPGGGRMVTFERGDDTWFHVVHGQQERVVDGKQPPTATHETLEPFNGPFEKPRRGRFQRYHDGPALVHKAGHFGYVCRPFEEELSFYTSNFNFVHTDVLFHDKFTDMDVMTFMHLDLGPEYSDHHIMFLQRAIPEVKKTYVHHTSYEVADFDTQLLGHEHLAKNGHRSVWGVGRHILGSQIFGSRILHRSKAATC